VIDLAGWLEATALAQHLKVSRWTYPLVNAGHVFGLALLVGSILALDLRMLGLARRGMLADVAALLRPVAAAGLVLAALTGAALFATQAGDYLASGWFRLKMALLAAALVNVALHRRLTALPAARRRAAAFASLCLWPAVLLAGRMIGYG